LIRQFASDHGLGARQESVREHRHGQRLYVIRNNEIAPIQVGERPAGPQQMQR